MIDATALVQLKAFARQDGAILALAWTASFALIVYSPQYSLGNLLALATPFIVGWRLSRFRDYALGGILAKTHGCKCAVENHKVVLTISDDGEGIAKEDVLHIFDRFYTGKNGNTGIGLALTKEIVKLHGGDVKAYNRNGAVFEMILPQAKTT